MKIWAITLWLCHCSPKTKSGHLLTLLTVASGSWGGPGSPSTPLSLSCTLRLWCINRELLFSYKKGICFPQSYLRSFYQFSTSASALILKTFHLRTLYAFGHKQALEVAPVSPAPALWSCESQRTEEQGLPRIQAHHGPVLWPGHLAVTWRGMRRRLCSPQELTVGCSRSLRLHPGTTGSQRIDSSAPNSVDQLGSSAVDPLPSNPWFPHLQNGRVTATTLSGWPHEIIMEAKCPVQCLTHSRHSPLLVLFPCLHLHAEVHCWGW